MNDEYGIERLTIGDGFVLTVTTWEYHTFYHYWEPNRTKLHARDIDHLAKLLKEWIGDPKYDSGGE